MKQFYRMLLTLCLPLLLCSQVQAQHSGPYIGAFFGGNALMNAKSYDSERNINLTLNPALQGSVVLGWDLEPGNPVGDGRIELEYTRRSNPLDQVNFGEGGVKGSGNVKAESLLINCFGVFHNKSPWAPYFGIGIGAARMEASDLKATEQALATGTDTVFAYQVGTGIELSLAKYLSLDLGYRFFSSVRPAFNETDVKKIKMDYLSHSAVFGLRVGF